MSVLSSALNDDILTKSGYRQTRSMKQNNAALFRFFLPVGSLDMCRWNGLGSSPSRVLGQCHLHLKRCAFCSTQILKKKFMVNKNIQYHDNLLMRRESCFRAVCFAECQLHEQSCF